MSLNTHKSWHIHREINREKTRQLQSNLDAAKSKSAAELNAILHGESVTTEELLQQIHELGGLRSVTPPVPDEHGPASTASVASFEEEFARFDPLVHPINDGLARKPLDMEDRRYALARQMESGRRGSRRTTKPDTIGPTAYNSHPRKHASANHAVNTQVRKH